MLIDILRYSCGGYAALLIFLWVLAEFRLIAWDTATYPCRYTIPYLKVVFSAAGFCA